MNKNWVITLAIFIGGCFLFERPYTPVGHIEVLPIESYRYQESSVKFKQDVETIIKITDRLAKKYEMVEIDPGSILIRHYAKEFKSSWGILFVYYDFKEDLIRISVDANRDSFDTELVGIAEELAQELQAEFGRDRTILAAEFWIE